jgi:Secretion system C-terminal sorting domain
VIQSGHMVELSNDISLKNITLRVIGILSLNNGRTLNLNSGSIINVISGGRIKSQNPSDQSAIYLAGAAKFRGTKVFNSNWGAGVIYGLAYATSTTGNIDQSGTGFIIGNLPAVWQDFNLFRTTDNHVQMVWVTSHETGTRIFHIERSRNAQTWDVIGEIESPGSPGSQNIYNFVDSDPGSGIVYYRVREIDPDGLYKFSSVRSLRMEESVLDNKIFPNPARSMVQVKHKKVPDGQSKLFLYNVNGQTIKVINLSQGSILETIDISGLKNGMYLIQVRHSDGSTQHNSLVKY